MQNRIAQGVAFVAGVVAGWYLYRVGFYRGRVEQSRCIRAERARLAFDPMAAGLADLEMDEVAEAFRLKHLGEVRA